MLTHLTTKGQVTIPKHIRDALNLKPGAPVQFAVNGEGQVVIVPGKLRGKQPVDRFEAARGTAEIKGTTEELMALLRPAD